MMDEYLETTVSVTVTVTVTNSAFKEEAYDRPILHWALIIPDGY